MTEPGLPILWLYGPSGVGKSTVGWEIFRLLGASGVPGAFVDGDQLGLCYPTCDEDPGNHRVKAANLGAAWQGFRAVGARCLVLSGYVLTAEQVRLYAGAVPDAALTLCRLRASAPVLQERYVRRGYQVEYLAETLSEAQVLDGSELSDIVVDTDGHSAQRLARQICGPGGVWPVLAGEKEA